MAIARPGPLTTITSGALGGLILVSSKKGQIVRIRPILKTRTSASTLTNRAVHKRTLNAWRALTDTQRRAWSTAAANYTSSNRLGIPRPITGLQLYVSITAPAIAAALAPVTVPPVPLVFSPFATMPYTCTNSAFTITPTLLYGSPFGQVVIQGARSLRSAATLPQPRVFKHYRRIANFSWGGAAIDLFAAFNTSLGALDTREWFSLRVYYIHLTRAITPPYILYGNRSN